MSGASLSWQGSHERHVRTLAETKGCHVADAHPLAPHRLLSRHLPLTPCAWMPARPAPQTSIGGAVAMPAMRTSTPADAQCISFSSPAVYSKLLPSHLCRTGTCRPRRETLRAASRASENDTPITGTLIATLMSYESYAQSVVVCPRCERHDLRTARGDCRIASRKASPGIEGVRVVISETRSPYSPDATDAMSCLSQSSMLPHVQAGKAPGSSMLKVDSAVLMSVSLAGRACGVGSLPFLCSLPRAPTMCLVLRSVEALKSSRICMQGQVGARPICDRPCAEPCQAKNSSTQLLQHSGGLGCY